VVKSLILWTGLFLWSLACLLWGLLSMFSPQTLQRFMEWYTRGSTWSTAKGPPPVKGTVSQRIAGFFAILMGAWMAFRLMAGLLRFRVSAAAPAHRLPAPGTDRHWSALVGAILCVGLGTFAMLRPQIALRMTKANFPNRELSDEAVRRALQGGRVLGVLTILFGAFLLFLWYRWTG
jgi:ABC-type multidrug transport system fused ATPase/permease subunit